MMKPNDLDNVQTIWTFNETFLALKLIQLVCFKNGEFSVLPSPHFLNQRLNKIDIVKWEWKLKKVGG